MGVLSAFISRLSTFVVVVNAEQSAGECQYLAESYQHRVVYLTGRWQYEPCNEQSAAERDKSHGGDELYCRFVFAYVHVFAMILSSNHLAVWNIMANFVSDKQNRA